MPSVAAVARLALAHRSCTQDPEDQVTDDDAFAWVQQCLEDISATLRGLALGRAGSWHTGAAARSRGERPVRWTGGP